MKRIPKLTMKKLNGLLSDLRQPFQPVGHFTLPISDDTVQDCKAMPEKFKVSGKRGREVVEILI